MELLELQVKILSTLKSIMEALHGIQKANAPWEEQAKLPPWGKNTPQKPRR